RRCPPASARDSNQASYHVPRVCRRQSPRASPRLTPGSSPMRAAPSPRPAEIPFRSSPIPTSRPLSLQSSGLLPPTRTSRLWTQAGSPGLAGSAPFLFALTSPHEIQSGATLEAFHQTALSPHRHRPPTNHSKTKKSVPLTLLALLLQARPTICLHPCSAKACRRNPPLAQGAAEDRRHLWLPQLSRDAGNPRSTP